MEIKKHSNTITLGILIATGIAMALSQAAHHTNVYLVGLIILLLLASALCVLTIFMEDGAARHLKEYTQDFITFLRALPSFLAHREKDPPQG